MFESHDHHLVIQRAKRVKLLIALKNKGLSFTVQCKPFTKLKHRHYLHTYKYAIYL